MALEVEVEHKRMFSVTSNNSILTLLCQICRKYCYTWSLKSQEVPAQKLLHSVVCRTAAQFQQHGTALIALISLPEAGVGIVAVASFLYLTDVAVKQVTRDSSRL